MNDAAEAVIIQIFRSTIIELLKSNVMVEFLYITV